jgi:hypothetical protein
MVHHRQRLPFRLESGNHLPRVEARLDYLERDLAANGVLLLGHVDHAEAAFPCASSLAADYSARAFAGTRNVEGASLFHHLDGIEKLPDPLAERRMFIDVLLYLWMFPAAKARCKIVRQRGKQFLVGRGRCGRLAVRVNRWLAGSFMGAIP